MNSPSMVKAVTAFIAAPVVSVGRMIEQIGRFVLRNGVGSGMIRFACKCSSVLPWRSTNVTVELFIGSETMTGVAFPALSCQV